MIPQSDALTSSTPTTAVVSPLRMALLPRIRRCTVFFIIGLVFSGATAVPIPTQFDLAARVFGENFSAGGVIPDVMAAWLRTVRAGVLDTSAHAPFMFYGTDWLAFGHFVIALAFVGAWRDPVRNRWLYRFGLMACAAVPVWALVFGAIRGIPLWWRGVDASFGIIGFVPVWLCHRWIARIEEEERVRP